MKRLIALFILLPGLAFAQQAATPTEQALSIKLSNEISQGLQCSTAVITMQAELAKANARIKELEAKQEDKK